MPSLFVFFEWSIQILKPELKVRYKCDNHNFKMTSTPSSSADLKDININLDAKRKKKEEARQRKRKLIEDSGGIRPRVSKDKDKKSDEKNKRKKSKKKIANSTIKTTYFKKGADGKVQNEEDTGENSNTKGSHRFGRVMDQVPCTNKPRYSTLSMAVPGSVVANCQTRELRTVVVGQIARAAAVYHVDEIIIFDDNLSTTTSFRSDHSYNRRNRRHHQVSSDQKDSKSENDHDKPSTPNLYKKESEPHTFMARVLQYCECPQYLRRAFFPMHPDLQFAGLLHPLDAPHHVRAGERSKYREGVVLQKSSAATGRSLVNVGIFKTPVEINMTLTPGIRCTVELDPKISYLNSNKHKSVQGKVVSPNAPKEDDGTYWGVSSNIDFFNLETKILRVFI